MGDRRTAHLEIVAKAARRAFLDLTHNDVLAMRGNRVRHPGSGRQHFISHARVLDLVDALAQLEELDTANNTASASADRPATWPQDKPGDERPTHGD